MASSVEMSSTNDVSSTRNSSFVVAHTLTTDAIIKECIKQGFYRTPVCNEKLYLHNKGFDSIAPTAFEPYTDVKVLWLEGNGLSTLPCGGDLIQVRPPNRHDPFAEDAGLHDASSEEEEGEENSIEASAHPVAARTVHVDPTAGLLPESTGETTSRAVSGKRVLPECAEVAAEQRDGFSSLYPTVRQLYLHNNIFRVMPDLSRFQRLDSINLANNFFGSVEPHCPLWAAALERHKKQEKEKEDAAKAAAREAQQRAEAVASSTPPQAPIGVSKSRQKEKDGAEQRELARPPGSEDSVASPLRNASMSENVTSEVENSTNAIPVDAAHGAMALSGEAAAEDTSSISTKVLSREEARRQRALALTACQKKADVFTAFCTHNPLDVDDGGKLPEKVPRSQRNPCSSLRTLNLAGNHLETFDDCLPLLCYKALTVLDLSQNNIKDGEALLLILERMPRLRSLKLSGNPLVRTMPRYRKSVIARCKRLLHLDDRPVFDDERRLVTAWATGGEDGEAKERLKIKSEAEAAQKKRLDDFRALIAQHQGGPHQAYINAISTTDAVHRASEEGRGATAARGGGHLVRGDRRMEDPDSSATSSDDDDDTESENAVEPIATPLNQNKIAVAPVNGAGVEGGEGESTNVSGAVGVLQHNGRPPITRVLSCNRRVEVASASPSHSSDGGAHSAAAEAHPQHHSRAEGKSCAHSDPGCADDVEGEGEGEEGVYVYIPQGSS